MKHSSPERTQRSRTRLRQQAWLVLLASVVFTLAMTALALGVTWLWLHEDTPVRHKRNPVGTSCNHYPNRTDCPVVRPEADQQTPKEKP